MRRFWHKLGVFILAGSLFLTPGVVWGQKKIENPLAGAGVDNVQLLIVRIIQFLLGLSVILALLALVIGGIRYILAFGNEQALSSAKRIIIWSLVGLAIIILSFAIVRLVTQILGIIPAPP